ncbi:hypothetical protein DTO164E3_5853 [Paecilomyces variotii]|nr:hypothetical protein DTO032I3_6439 [Paecilomyces variotii]KAJ9197139.1 hypothetical protein DTO164E3_5853 [Paecilomyces variotii]KAJ9376160.1 hypothetical protein DTO032I4_8672 [Paecilomyces variotii]
MTMEWVPVTLRAATFTLPSKSIDFGESNIKTIINRGPPPSMGLFLKKKKKKKAFIEVRRYEPRNVGRADDFRIFKIICISQDYDELYVFRPTPGTGPPRAPRQAAPPPGNDSVHRWAISCPPRKKERSASCPPALVAADETPPPPPADDPPPPPAGDGPPGPRKTSQVLGVWESFPHWGLLGRVLGLRPPPPPHRPRRAG